MLAPHKSFTKQFSLHKILVFLCVGAGIYSARRCGGICSTHPSSLQAGKTLCICTMWHHVHIQMYAEVLRTQNNTGTYIYDYVLFQPLSFVVSKLFLFGCFSTKKWLSSWWFQPNWNNIKVVKFDHFPNFRGEHKKSLSCHHLDNMYVYIYMLYIYI